MKTLLALALALIALFAWPAAVSSAELGDPAAPLDIAEWIKGKPVDLAAGKGKTIFVVEFWATWCPPCRASIPHLTELQKKFKDVVFVGISDEKVPTVKSFVEKMGEKMDYVVAVDKDRKTSAKYMEAYGINGIPHAFIVDKQGEVVWNGHPMADLEKTLEDLIAGKYSIGLAKKRTRGQQLLQEFFQVVSQGKDEAKANELANQLEAIDKEVGGLIPGRKFEVAEIRKTIKFQAAMNEFQRAVSQGQDEVEVARLAQAAEALAPNDVPFAQFKQQLLVQSDFQQYVRAVSGGGDEVKAAALAKKLSVLESKDAVSLNEMAWTLLTDPKIKKRNLPLALKLAQSSYDASEKNDPAILDTLARALFDNGKLSDAVSYQKKAMEAAKDNKEMRDALEATLKKYQEKAGTK